MREKKKLGYPQRILLNQYVDCVERTKKKIDLKGTEKLVRFMLEESSIVQSDGAMSYQNTARAIDLINKKLCPGQWCTRAHCESYSSHRAYSCTKTRPSVCNIYKKYVQKQKERLEKKEASHD